MTTATRGGTTYPLILGAVAIVVLRAPKEI